MGCFLSRCPADSIPGNVATRPCPRDLSLPSALPNNQLSMTLATFHPSLPFAMMSTTIRFALSMPPVPLPSNTDSPRSRDPHSTSTAINRVSHLRLHDPHLSRLNARIRGFSVALTLSLCRPAATEPHHHTTLRTKRSLRYPPTAYDHRLR